MRKWGWGGDIGVGVDLMSEGTWIFSKTSWDVLWWFGEERHDLASRKEHLLWWGDCRELGSSFFRGHGSCLIQARDSQGPRCSGGQGQWSLLRCTLDADQNQVHATVKAQLLKLKLISWNCTNTDNSHASRDTRRKLKTTSHRIRDNIYKVYVWQRIWI